MNLFSIICALSLIFLPFGCRTPSTRLPKPTSAEAPPTWISSISRLSQQKQIEFLTKKQAEAVNPADRFLAAFRLSKIMTNPCPHLKEALDAQKNVSVPADIKNRAPLRYVRFCFNESGEWLEQSRVVVEQIAAINSPYKKDALQALIEYHRAKNEIPQEREYRLQVAPFLAGSAETLENQQRLLQILSPHPDAEDASEARLYETASRFRPLPPPGEWLKVAEDFKTARQFDPAWHWFKRASESPHLSWSDRIRALDGLRQILRLRGDRDQALRYSQMIYRLSSQNLDPDSALSSGLAYARALWTQHDRSGTKKVVNRLRLSFRNHRNFGEVLFLSARIAAEEEKFQESLKWYKLAQRYAPNNKPFQERVLWQKGWLEFNMERFEEARLTWNSLVRLEDEPFSQTRARYWIARALLRLDRTAEAQSELKLVAENDPGGYYGILAHRQLNIPFKPISESSPLPPSDLNIDDPVLNTNEWFVALDEGGAGKVWIEAIGSQLAPQQQMYLLSRVGAYAPLFWIFSKSNNQSKNEILQSQPRFVFPMLWEATVKQSADRFRVPMELVYSIMRQESAFDTKARSAADAFGLMQILPEIAQQASERHGVSLKTFSDLENEEVNISIGVALLSDLLAKYQNQFVLAVAAYNANDRAIRGWLKNYRGTDPTVFIEEIPYEETRNYVKLVMRNYVFYQRILNSPSLVHFPDWCLKPLQAHNK